MSSRAFVTYRRLTATTATSTSKTSTTKSSSGPIASAFCPIHDPQDSRCAGRGASCSVYCFWDDHRCDVVVRMLDLLLSSPAAAASPTAPAAAQGAFASSNPPLSHTQTGHRPAKLAVRHAHSPPSPPDRHSRGTWPRQAHDYLLEPCHIFGHPPPPRKDPLLAADGTRPGHSVDERLGPTRLDEGERHLRWRRLFFAWSD